MASLVVATSGTVSGLANNDQINNIAENLATRSQGGSAPTPGTTGLTSTAGLDWHDVGNAQRKTRNQADTGWITEGQYDETNGYYNPVSSGGYLVSAGPGIKNPVINGGFRIWQRGTSFTNPGYGPSYTADRWTTFLNGSGATVTVSLVGISAAADAPVQNAGLNAWYSWNQTVAGSGNVSQIIQKIEGVSTFAGQTVVLSFWAKSAAGNVVLSFFASQFFGTGGSPSSTVNTSGVNFTLGTVPQLFQTTFTLPTINGKTLGTNGDDSLWLVFGPPPAAVFQMYITGVQLELGTQATPFDKRPIATEIALCQRYYELFQASARFPASAASQAMSVPINYKATKRAVPTISQIGAGTVSNAASALFYGTDGNGTRLEIVSTGSGDCYWLNFVMAAVAEL